MSEYIQENRRAVIMLVVALCVALLGGLYLLLSGGAAESEELPPVARHEQPQPEVTAEPVDQTDTSVTTVVARGTGVNPFGPLTGTEEDAATSSDPTPSPTKTSSTSTPNKTATSDDPSSMVGTGPSKTEPRDEGGSKTGDKPESVVPKPINKGKDAEDSVPVALIEVQADYVVARVDGGRTKLYISIPGTAGVTYVAALGGDCAWIGRTDVDERVSVCVGESERI